MRDELMGFQKKAVAALLNELSSAVSYHKVDGRPQVIAFRAPTGSGKTIVMAMKSSPSGRQTICHL